MALTGIGAGWRHLWRGLRIPHREFRVRRHMSCVAGHSYRAAFWFTDWGKVLLNPEALDCPRCGREGVVL